MSHVTFASYLSSYLQGVKGPPYTDTRDDDDMKASASFSVKAWGHSCCGRDNKFAGGDGVVILPWFV